MAHPGAFRTRLQKSWAAAEHQALGSVRGGGSWGGGESEKRTKSRKTAGLLGHS